MIKWIPLIFAGAGLIFFGRCGKTDGISGTGTLIGNPTASVSGSLYYIDGLPATGVNVHIQKHNSLAITQATKIASIIDTASVTTDNYGVFAFETTLDSGLYAIEAISGNNSVFIDSIHVRGLPAPLVLPPDTLRSAGAVNGIVKLATSDDPGNVYVLAFGINRFAPVKSDGSFVFYPLAQGDYNLQIISSLPDYGVLDMNNVSVQPSDTTNLGVLELPYSGIPIPKDVTLSYDTLKQIVTVHWSTPATGIVKSFNIYRRDIDSSISYKLINSTSITGNSFDDSLAIQDHDYGYCVAIVDTFDSEGPKSVEVECKAVGAFASVSNASLDVRTFGDIDFVTDIQDNIWVTDNHENKVYKFNSGGDLLTSWVISGYSADEDHAEMAIDSQKNIYLRNAQGIGSVQKYDSAGTMIWSMDDTSIYVNRISVSTDGYLYCKGSKRSDGVKGIYQGYIYKYNPDGTFNKSWKVNSHDVMEGIIVKNGKVYCAGATNISYDDYTTDNTIDIFDTSGTLISSIHLRQKGDQRSMWVNAIAIDNNGILYCTESNSQTVRLFDKNSDFIGKFRIASEASLHELAIQDNGTILIQLSNFRLSNATIITVQKQIKQ